MASGNGRPAGQVTMSSSWSSVVPAHRHEWNSDVPTLSRGDAPGSTFRVICGTSCRRIVTATRESVPSGGWSTVSMFQPNLLTQTIRFPSCRRAVSSS
jgi:hypothetical protein